jgi:hypothetical protein
MYGYRILKKSILDGTWIKGEIDGKGQSGFGCAQEGIDEVKSMIEFDVDMVAGDFKVEVVELDSSDFPIESTSQVFDVV